MIVIWDKGTKNHHPFKIIEFKAQRIKRFWQVFEIIIVRDQTVRSSTKTMKMGALLLILRGCRGHQIG